MTRRRLRRVVRVGGLAAAAAGSLALAVAPAVEPRLKRLHFPPAPAPVSAGGGLPTALSVDETEFSLSPSRVTVAAGEVTFSVYNRGMDDHDLAVQDADGVVRRVDVPPRESRELVVNVPPGRLKLWCSLFAGTPVSHESLGMVVFIDAQ